MKYLLYSLFIGAIALAGCSGECPMQKDLAAKSLEIDSLKAQLADWETEANATLIHTVFIEMKEGSSTQEKQVLKNALESLSSIEGVLGLHVGEPEATSDARLVADYTFVLQMRFESEEMLEAYQQNDKHLKLRERLADLLAKPPVVYDYWIR